MFSFFKKKTVEPAPTTPPEAAAAPAAQISPATTTPVPPTATVLESATPAASAVEPGNTYSAPFAGHISADASAASPANTAAATPASASDSSQPTSGVAAAAEESATSAVSPDTLPALNPVLPAAPETSQENPAFTPGIAYGELSMSATPVANDVPPPAPSESKRSWLARLKAGLAKTSANLSLLFLGAKIDDDLYEELEAALLMADAGVDATEYLLSSLKKKVKGRHQPLTMMIAGVNGAGKTTTIGKLAKHMQAHRQSVLLAAGDTFRAAAREQLTIWGQRNNVTVIAQESGDPAAVAFDAVSAGRARKMDVVMVDTAGRLPTQLHLMEELKKIKRVLGKAQEGAPHEVLLVIDGNTGQNALAQVKAFDDALQLSGLVITKLDGTAKGGVLAAIARVRPVPVYFIGVGEKIEDLQAFNAAEFVDALLG